MSTQRASFRLTWWCLSAMLVVGFGCVRPPREAPLALVVPPRVTPPPIAERGLCGSDGWCFQNPLPQSERIRAAWRAGADLYVAGEAGLIMRFDGERWHRLAAPGNPLLAFFDVWGSGPRNIYVVGGDGRLYHFDGEAWAAIAGGPFASVWGSRADDVFAGGENGAVHHFDGLRWKKQSSGIFGPISSIRGNGSTDVLAVGSGGMSHYDGSQWTYVPLPSNIPLSKVAIRGDHAVVLGSVLLTREGGTWREEPSDGPPWSDGNPESVWIGSTGAIFVAGDRGMIYRKDGATWTKQEHPALAVTKNVGGSGFHALAGEGEDDLYALGNAGVVVHLDHGVWRSVSSGHDVPHLRGISGTSPRDVWAVGDGAVLHHDGKRWELRRRSPERLHGVWAFGPSEVLAVGTSADDTHGVVMRVDKPDGPILYTVNAALRGIWASSSRDVWAVGKEGTIVHYDGSSWVTVPTTTKEDLTSVWGRSPRDVFVAGNRILLHFDGTTWQTWPSQHGFDRVRGCEGDVLALGGRTIARFDGRAWQETELDRTVLPYAHYLLDVFCTPGSDARAFTVSGDVLRGHGRGWTKPAAPAAQMSLHALWGSEEAGIFGVGEEGVIVHRPFAAR